MSPQLKRRILIIIRGAAWVVVLSLMLSQIVGDTAGDLEMLGMFVIGGLLYAISLVLEKKYHW